MARVLLVDDDEVFAAATIELLELLGHSVDHADSVKEAGRLLSSRSYNRVFLDLMLPDGSGFHLLEYLPEDIGNTKVTIITGHPSVKNHVMSLYGMNVNYLIKPIELDQLKQLFEEEDEPRERPAAVAFDRSGRRFGELIGESQCMQDVYSMIERVAKTEANVMLIGESGVGKEVVARAIHNASGFSGPMIASNCGAMSKELVGSELFGHEKGAFTGATNRKTGVFEQARDGTLFLDEITEMPLDMQTNLLRVLETRSLTRLGGTEVIPVNCRVVSATNRSEAQIVESKAMREDIYYRLAVFPIRIPPLRDRLEDIPLLVEAFLEELNTAQGSALEIDADSLARLKAYDWPGNVRELRHVIHRAFIMSDPEGRHLNFPQHFASPFSRRQEEQNASLVGKTIEDVEKRLIMETLAEVDGNKTRAAEMLGVSVKTLYNRLNAYESEEVGEKA